MSSDNRPDSGEREPRQAWSVEWFNAVTGKWVELGLYRHKRKAEHKAEQTKGPVRVVDLVYYRADRPDPSTSRERVATPERDGEEVTLKARFAGLDKKGG